MCRVAEVGLQTVTIEISEITSGAYPPSERDLLATIFYVVI